MNAQLPRVVGTFLIYVPPSRRDPLNDRTSPKPFRAANIAALRLTTIRRRHVHHLRAAVFAVRYRPRRAPSQRDAHRQGTAAHITARRSQLPRGRRFKAPRVRQTSFPSGTAGVRSCHSRQPPRVRLSYTSCRPRNRAQVGRALYRQPSTAQPRGRLIQENFISNTGTFISYTLES